MEWRYPKACGRAGAMGERFPINDLDLPVFLSRAEKLNEDEISDVLLEALAAVYQVEALQRELRVVDRAIRLLEKSRISHYVGVNRFTRTALNETTALGNNPFLESDSRLNNKFRSNNKPFMVGGLDANVVLERLRDHRLGLRCLAIPLREALRRPAFTRYLPRTRHNLYRRTVRIFNKNEPEPAVFLQKTARIDKIRSALCAPGVISDATVIGIAASSLQWNQTQTKIEFAASFWDDKPTTLQEFITKGKR